MIHLFFLSIFVDHSHIEFWALLKYYGISHLLILNSLPEFWLVPLFLTYGGMSQLFILISLTQFWLVALWLNFYFRGHTVIFIINEHTGANAMPMSTSSMLSTVAKETTVRVG